MKNLFFITLILFVACGKVKIGVPGDKAAKPDGAINTPLRNGAVMTGLNLISAKIICGQLGEKNKNFHQNYLNDAFKMKLTITNCNQQSSVEDFTATLKAEGASSPLYYSAATGSGLFYSQEDTNIHGPFTDICKKISLGDVVNDYVDINANIRDVYTFSGTEVKIERGQVGGSITNLIKYNLNNNGPFVGMISSRVTTSLCNNAKSSVVVQTITETP